MGWWEKIWKRKSKSSLWNRKAPSGKKIVLRVSARWLIFLSLLLGLILIQLYSGETSLKSLNLKIGEISPEDIVAEFEFPLPRQQEDIDRDKEKSAANIPLLLINQKDVTSIQEKAIKNFFQDLDDLLKKKDTTYQDRLQVLQTWGLNLSQNSIDVLLTTDGANSVQAAIQKTTPNILSNGIIKDKNIPLLSTLPLVPLIMKKNGREKQIQLTDIFDEREVKEKLSQTGAQLFDDPELANTFYEVGTFFIKPNLTYNREEREHQILEAYKLIPTIETIIKKDEKIIGKHERVSDFQFRALQAYIIAKEARMDETQLAKMFIARLGQIVFTTLILGCMVLYLKFNRRDIYDDNSKLILISVLIFVVAILSLLIINANLSPYLIPVTFASILISILIDTKLSVFLSLIIIILLGTFPALRFYARGAALIGAIAGVYSVKELRHRYHFYRPMFFVSLGYALAIIGSDMIKLTNWEQIFQNIGFGVVNSVGSTILAIGFLPVFESIFKITTNITLLELADFQRPLLKKLTMEAPGTQSHSLIIGNLSEAAAESINADSLLCRVASYYHDIGKTAKPEYFVENQRGYNPHDHLSPSMSTLIIMSHVKEGIEMAKKAGLPQCIIDMIPQHHGTGLVYYFYKKALEQDDTVNEHDFRYPGPKPQSKEAGIIMISDSVESASRTLKDPTPQKLKAMIQKIINMKFVDGQLDECDLTLRDLNKITDALLGVLIGMTHERIDYPIVQGKEAKNETIYKSETK